MEKYIIYYHCKYDRFILASDVFWLPQTRIESIQGIFTIPHNFKEFIESAQLDEDIIILEKVGI